MGYVSFREGKPPGPQDAGSFCNRHHQDDLAYMFRIGNPYLNRLICHMPTGWGVDSMEALERVEIQSFPPEKMSCFLDESSHHSIKLTTDLHVLVLH